jgi:hypothetical protein
MFCVERIRAVCAQSVPHNIRLLCEHASCELLELHAMRSRQLSSIRDELFGRRSSSPDAWQHYRVKYTTLYTLEVYCARIASRMTLYSFLFFVLFVSAALTLPIVLARGWKT